MNSLDSVADYNWSAKDWITIAGLAIVGFVFHTINLDYASYDLDEAVHIWHAQKTYSEVVAQAANDPNPPIYNLLISSWVKNFGVSEWTTRFLSVLMGGIGIILMYALGARNFGFSVGLIAALLYCFSPIQFRFTHLARPYAMLMVSVMLSYGLLFECIRKPSKAKYLLFYLATTLMIYVHPTSIFNVAAQGIIILMHGYKDVKRLFALSLPLVLAVGSFGLWVLAIPYFQRDDAMWFDAPDWEAIWYVIQVFYGNPWLVAVQAAILLIILLRRFMGSSSSTPLKSILMMLTWAVIPFVISVGFSHLIKPVFQDKYVLSVQPALMLLLAYSIVQSKPRLLKLASLALVSGMLFSSIDLKRSPEGDWRNVVAYVKDVHNENSMVFVEPWYEYRTYSFYHDRNAFEVPDSTLKYLVADGITTAWHDVFEDESKAEVIHIVSAHEGFAKSDLVKDHLAQAIEIARKKFTGITVASYRFLDDAATRNSTLARTSISDDFLESSEEFSSTIELKLDGVISDKGVVVEAQTTLAPTESELTDVMFVATVEQKGQPALEYRSKYVGKMVSRDKPFTVTHRFFVPKVDSSSYVKVYLWNKGKQEFQIIDLSARVVN